MDFVRKMWQLFTSLIRRWNVAGLFRWRDLAATAYAIRAKGMTTLNDAIVSCEDSGGQAGTSKAIVILSDGIDTYSNGTLKEKALESALAVGATIFAVDMASLEIAGSARRQSAMSLQGFAEELGEDLSRRPVDQRCAMLSQESRASLVSSTRFHIVR